LLKNVSEEAFTFERRRVPEYNFLPAGPVLFPYLLVNVGSGVSILKVHSEDGYTRIGGYLKSESAYPIITRKTYLLPVLC